MTDSGRDLSDDPADCGLGEVRLAPPDGLSETQRLIRSRILPGLDAARPSSRRQFTIASLMVITLFVCAGLSGASWMPAPVFAGIVGLLTLVVLTWTSREPAENAVARWAWIGVTISYVAACVVAVVRMTS